MQYVLLPTQDRRRMQYVLLPTQDRRHRKQCVLLPTQDRTTTLKQYVLLPIQERRLPVDDALRRAPCGLPAAAEFAANVISR